VQLAHTQAINKMLRNLNKWRKFRSVTAGPKGYAPYSARTARLKSCLLQSRVFAALRPAAKLNDAAPVALGGRRSAGARTPASPSAPRPP